ncbi:MAG: hypothetical protein KDD53_03395 [Bdellovibrionales bacterium]|nr:hypothetical protein [Bdellovibrionales bacterium]
MEVFEQGKFGVQSTGEYLFQKGIVLPSSIHLAEKALESVTEIVDELTSILSEIGQS